MTEEAKGETEIDRVNKVDLEIDQEANKDAPEAEKSESKEEEIPF